MEENGVQKAAEYYVKRYFGGGKGAALEIRQAWRERRRIQGYRGIRIWGREKWVSVCWDGDRGRPGGRMILCGFTTEVYGIVARGGYGHPPQR